MFYRDRSEAGQLLAQELAHYRGRSPAVIAIPRGGVVVGATVARSLGGSLDLVLINKIRTSAGSDTALGAVTSDGQIILEPHLQNAAPATPAPWLKAAIQQAKKEISRQRALYVGDRPFPDLTERVTILVDDGVSTGFTVMAALRWLNRQAPEQLVLAVPLAPAGVLEELSLWCDRIVCPRLLEAQEPVDVYYERFAPVTDQEVRRLLTANIAG